MKEIAAVISHDGEPLFWLNGSNSTAIPDSQDLWQFVWENRDKVDGIAHTHPGRGSPRPSTTDLSTFKAIENALGRYLTWWILTEDQYIIMRRYEPKEGSSDDYDLYASEDGDLEWCGAYPSRMIAWMSELRKLSYGGENNG